MKIKKSLFRFCAFFLIFIIFVFPEDTIAQTYLSFQSELDDIVERTRVRIGPFRIVPRIGFQFLRYDWNVFYQAEDEKPAGDFNSTISPELNVYFIFKDRLILKLTDRISYIHFYKFKDQRRFNNFFSPELKLLFLNRFVLTGTYSSIRDRRRPTSEFNIWANQYRENIRGSLFYETPRQTSIGISYSQNIISYDDITFPGQEVTLSRILNRKEETIEFEFNYSVFSESFFFITGRYTDHDFEHKENFDRTAYSFQSLTGLRFPLVGGITGTFAVGLQQIVPRTQGKEGITGLIGNTSLNFRREWLGARISFIRDFPFSMRDNNVFYVDNRYLFGVSIYPLKFLRIDYDYSLGYSKYPELIPLFYPDGSFENIRRIDNYRIHTLRFVFKLFEAFGLGISLNQWARDSNYLGESRSQLYLDASLTLDF